MELKLVNIARAGGANKLLIVPYGIETSAQPYTMNKLGLLIVPYGIETTLIMFHI